MVSNKENTPEDSSFGFGLGIISIVASILTFYSYSHLGIRIGCAVGIFLGFFGIGLEFENIKMRGPYKMSVGFSLIVLAFWSKDYALPLFIVFVSTSIGIFFSALVEYLLKRRTFDSAKEKHNKFAFEIEGILSVIGSILSIMASIVGLVTSILN